MTAGWSDNLERQIIYARSPDGRDLFTGCILYLGVSGSSLLSRPIRIKRKTNNQKRKELNELASRLSIENDRLKVGQVKRVTSNNGNKIDSISLLLNESVEVLFAPNGNTLEFTVSNPNIDMSNLDCTIDKETLRDLVISFKDAYNQIIANESEDTNS